MRESDHVMDVRFRAKVLIAWQTRASDADLCLPPADESDLVEFETQFGPIPSDYRWFLRTCGGGVVGSERIDGIHDLATTHQRFRSQSDSSDGWTMTDVFVIGWDGAGNSFGIHVPTGRILGEDHDFGGIHEMSASFAQFLSEGLSLAN